MRKGKQGELDFGEDKDEEKEEMKGKRGRPKAEKEPKGEEEKTPRKTKEAPSKPRIVPTTVEQEMKSSYIDYAMSVIVGRALPDARDGLKPVHRRILYAMDGLGLAPGKPYRKSARVVGEVLGKYHPHGDVAVYDAMVRMAQDFSLRYMLVDGQGNFGSVDGDAPAAMRYTEARLAAMATEMLTDLEKNTVDFGPNFDDSLKEPLVLPSKFPNLLVNGASGIAVGMATNIPPHNLVEICDGAVASIEDPKIEIGELTKIVKGPDFPTGALICGKAGIEAGYKGGKGLLTLRARVEAEETKSGRKAIIIKELPYQVNKAKLIEEIAEHVKEKKVSGISDLRDESDRSGMRVYIELKRDAKKEVVLNQLYNRTKMQVTFGMNMVALVEGAPRTLNLKEMMECYIGHREEVVTRRSKFELKKAEDEAHILEGLRIAVANIDAVIKLIKASKSPDEARTGLMGKFKLTKKQAQAILDMKLARLTQLERTKIDEDHKKLKKIIAGLKELLATRKRILGVVKKELLAMKDKYGDPRRTEITAPVEEIEEEALIPEVEVAILLTRDGYVKRMPLTAFRSQLRGGRGVMGMTTREEDEIENIFVASTHSYILFFTNKGRVYRLKVYELPESSRAGKGQAIANLLQLSEGEGITAAVPVKEFKKKAFLVMATRAGLTKKTELSAFENIRRTGIIAIALKGEDELGWVKLTDGKREIILGTQNGMIIRFKESDVRPMGRAAAGVRGIGLRKGDKVVSMDAVREAADLLALSQQGYGKRMKISEFKTQRRGGKGMTAMKLRKKDLVAQMKLINPDDELLFVTAKGTMSKQKAKGISTQGRYAKGVRIQRVDPDDYIVDLARVVKKEEKV